jgi:hypothetical protein
MINLSILQTARKLMDFCSWFLFFLGTINDCHDFRASNIPYTHAAATPAFGHRDA